MPAIEGAVKYEFERNRALVSNQTAHDADPQTFVTYLDVINDLAGRRRKRPGKGNAKGANAGFEISAIHEFARTDPTTGVITYYIFRTFNTSIQRWNGAAWVNSLTTVPFTPSSSAWVFRNFNNQCFACNGKDHFVRFDGSTGAVDGREWFYVGVDQPAVQPGYSALTGTEYATGTVTVTAGSTAVTGVGTAWTTGGAWNGLYIDIAGVRYQISSVGSGTTLTLTQPFRGATAAGLSYVIYTGLMDWSQAPRYAYAYKNPTTGHIGNVSPVLQVAEKDQVGRTITLTGIAYNAEAYKNGFTQIQIFRSAKNGYSLVAILNGIINNANAGGSTTFTEVSGGSSTFRDVDLTNIPAPLVINGRPVDASGNSLAFSSIGEWAGRLFAIAPRSSRLYWSGAPEDVPVGSPEECWPAKYNLVCTQPTGMVEIGAGDDNDQLNIHTAFGDRIVIGYDPLSFRLRRIKTRRTEGFQGGSTAVDGSLLELHRDKRVIDYGAGKDLGREIQDRLKACSSSLFTKSRVFWFAYGDKDYVLVSVPKSSGSTANDGTFIYDRDLDNLYEMSVGFSSFAQVHNTATGELELWAGTPAGDVFRLLDDTVFTDAGANIVPTLKTAWLKPAGESGKAQLAWIEIFTSETGSFTGAVVVNEEPNATDPDAHGQTIALVAVQQEYSSAKSKHWKAKPSKPCHFNAAQVQLTFPSTAGDIAIEKIIVVTKPISEGTVL